MIERTVPKYGLGDRLREKISGATGIVFGMSQWLTNCNTYGLRSEQLDNGKPSELFWIDEPLLELVEAGVFAGSINQRTGGPDRSVPMTNRQ